MTTAPEVPALRVIGLDVPFGSGPGLEDVTFQVAAGERLALVGASGAGKSSLLRAIAGTVRPTAGEIRIAGRDAAGLPVDDRNVLLLEQRPLLFPHLSVRRNVAFPLEVRGIRGKELNARVDEAMAAVKIGDLAGRSPGTLSGGQAHRVALARAVVGRPALLLLDEPFTGLDPELRSALQRTVIQATRRYRTSLLTVTHDLREAGRMGDRVGVLIDRRLARLARPAELYRDPGSLAVARFIGWPNDLPLTPLPGGGFGVAGFPLPGVECAPGDGAPRLVFGTDGAALSPAGRQGGLPVRILDVEHHPNGATATWVLADAAGAGESGDAPGERAEALSGEVDVDPARSPAPGSRLTLRPNPDRFRVYRDTSHGREHSR